MASRVTSKVQLGHRDPYQVILDSAKVRAMMMGRRAFEIVALSHHTISRGCMNRALSGLCLRTEVAQHLADTLNVTLADLGAAPYHERENPT